MTEEPLSCLRSAIIKGLGVLIFLVLPWFAGKGIVSATESFPNADLATSVAAVSIDKATPTRIQPALSKYVLDRFGKPPPVFDSPLSKELELALTTVFGDNLLSASWGPEQTAAVGILVQSGDARYAWLISDLMRIAGSDGLMLLLADSVNQLLKVNLKQNNTWGDTVDYLIAWNIPAPPSYLKYKRNIYTYIVPEWDRLFVEGDIDWRHVSWGGVRIDDREFGTTDAPCNCIPAADNPEVTDAASADWLEDDDIIFGLAINGEYRAYPRQIMEVREMVNDTLGGRDFGIPYCTLCGSAQAYFTDEMPEGVKRPVLRTSGLLIRSNKVMFDLNTYSIFDTFRGQAVTGPLAEKKIVLKQAGIVTTEWGAWKAAHPQTTVLRESLALGRDPDFRNNRDANGPIFPVGDVDPRLPVHEDIVGVITDAGTPVAFHKGKALAALKKGDEIAYKNIRLVLDAGGVRAVDRQGIDLGSHQAFWFAWSQFHPETKLWPFR